MKTEMVSRIGYRDVFGQNANIDEFLNCGDIDSALEFLVFINKFEYKLKENDTAEVVFIFKEWLVNSSSILKDKITDCYSKVFMTKQSHTDDEIDFKSIKIINKAATLRTIEILLSTVLNRNSKKTNNNWNENLFMLYLAVNDEIADRETKLFDKWIDKIEKKENEIRFHLFLGLSQVTLNQETPNKKAWVEILKFVQFEKWFGNQEKYKDFVDAYLEKFGVTTWYELITIIFHLNDISIDYIRFSKDLDKRYWKLLSYFAEHKESSTDWKELSEIIKKPLFKLSNGDYLILDYNYLLDKFFSGIYHDLLEFSKKNNVNKFHQDYSKDFVEGYLLVNSLKAVFGKSHIQFSEERIKSLGIKGIENLALPDYYIRNGNKVFIFECKNSFLSNQSKINTDCEALEKDICEKFYHNYKKKKAIKQLTNFIELSQDGKYQFFDKTEKLNKIKYYPILIVTDGTLTSIGFNKLFNEYFSNEIIKLKKDDLCVIKPMTIIHINDLLYRTSKLKKLDIIIDDYQTYCNKQKMPIEGMVSFTDYLDIHRFRKDYEIDKRSLEHIMKNPLLPDD